MSTVATGIRIALPSLFGASGRYYEFARPVELLVEQDADGNWHHTIAEFNLWVVEPGRDESLRALQECFDADYELFALTDDEKLMASARDFKQQILSAIKAVI